MSFKLALRNVRRSIRDYAVYFLTLTFGVCLFYVFNSLSGQSAMKMLAQTEHSMVEGILMLVEAFSVFVSVVLAGYLGVFSVLISLFLIMGRIAGRDSVRSFARGFAALFAGEIAGVLLGERAAGLDVQQRLRHHVGAGGHHHAVADVEHRGGHHGRVAEERLHHGEAEAADVQACAVEHEERALGDRAA